MARIVHVSDSHLSPNAPFSDSNWDAVVEHVRAASPDLVIHTGDISCNGADSVDDLRHARRQLDRLSVPWMAIPGNHDIGDAGDPWQPVNDERRARYSSALGDGSWSIPLDGWQVVGVDVQTLLSDLPAADHLWAWLAAELTAAAPIALFLHRPLRPWADTEHDEPHRYVPDPGRQRLEALIDGSHVRLIGSGHVHQWRHRVAGRADGPVAGIDAGRTEVWAPSTWAALPARIQPMIGDKVVGLVEYELASNGRVTTSLVGRGHITQLVSGDDFESPYTH